MLTSSHLAACNLLSAKVVTHAVAKWVRGSRRRSRRKRVKGGTRLGRGTRRRKRRSIEEIFRCLGPIYFRRAYRMTFESFLLLHAKLEDGISKSVSETSRINNTLGRAVTNGRGGNIGPKKGLNYKPPPVPNGPICTEVRLACAIRYFAGGSPYDLMGKFGISHTEVLESVWYVVEAINVLPEFFVSYPSDPEEQKRIAANFRAASAVEFDNCAGAIDGVLIWIHRPTMKDAKAAGIGMKKLFCGRKHKFGLNCQAVADKRGRFLDVSVNYGGSSADCLAFEASDLFQRLEGGLHK